jgi:hypothetical protein
MHRKRMPTTAMEVSPMIAARYFFGIAATFVVIRELALTVDRWFIQSLHPIQSLG